MCLSLGSPLLTCLVKHWLSSWPDLLNPSETAGAFAVQDYWFARNEKQLTDEERAAQQRDRQEHAAAVANVSVSECRVIAFRNVQRWL